MVIMQEKGYTESKPEIRSVLLTFQSAVSLDEFQRAYRGLIGQRLPSRTLGYTSDIDFLKSMPDVVHVSTNNVGKVMLTGIADEASQHIQKLVQRQRKVKPRTNSSKNGSRSSNYISNRPLFVPGPTRAEIIQVTAKYPDGITLPNFVLAYRKDFDKYLNLPRGLETLENMLNVISELEIKMVRNEKKIFVKKSQNQLRHNQTSMVKDAPPQSQVDDIRNSSVDKSGVPEDVQNNFKLVLSKCPEGIQAVHFPPLFENCTKQPLDIHALGYSSLVELVDSLPKIFQRVSNPSDSRNWIIFPANANVDHSALTQFNHVGKKSYSSDSDSSTQSFRKKFCKNIPDDCAFPFLQYKEPRMPKNIDLSNVPIFVSAIVSPGIFWFQLQTDEAKYELEELEHDLESFYGDYYSTKYNMQDSDIIIGASCVVLCPDDDQFYRAVIKSIPNLELVNIFFVDYGSRENVPRTHLRYVRQEYLDLPAHAFKGHLTGLRPPNNAPFWDSEAQQRFIDLCERATLMALLKQVDNETYSVELCDTNDNNIININDILVQEGHACFCQENSYDKISFSNSASSINSDAPSNTVSNFTLSDSTNRIPELPRYSYSDTVLHTEYKRTFNQIDEASELNLKETSIADKISYSSKKQDEDEDKEISDVPSHQHCKRYIKQLKLCKDSAINVINFEAKPYVSAGELSKLFWEDKESTYLAERLNFKGIEIPTRKISKENNFELFSQCLRLKLLDLQSNTSSLSLYPLEWAFKILNIFGHPSMCVRLAIKNEIETFDPQDPIWKEFIYLHSDLDKLEKEIEEKIGNLCLYDLKTKKEGLKLKKLKLQRMGDSATDEIERVDHMQFIIEKRMEHIESICSQFLN